MCSRDGAADFADASMRSHAGPSKASPMCASTVTGCRSLPAVAAGAAGPATTWPRVTRSARRAPRCRHRCAPTAIPGVRRVPDGRKDRSASPATGRRCCVEAAARTVPRFAVWCRRRGRALFAVVTAPVSQPDRSAPDAASKTGSISVGSALDAPSPNELRR